MSDENDSDDWSEYLFLAGFFAGLGLGFLFGQVPAGVLLGLAAGFLMMGIAKKWR